MEFQFLRTGWKGMFRRSLNVPLDGVYLLPFSSWNPRQRPDHSLVVPTLPKGIVYAVDCGGYRFTQRGGYPFHALDYVDWCQSLDPPPLWVAMPDWLASFPDAFPCGSTAPLPLMLPRLYAMHLGQDTCERVAQLRTSFLAYALWDHYRDAVPQWLPTLQGRQTSGYIWHARFLKSLFTEMQQYYGAAFRVGIGSLATRKPQEILDIVSSIASILPGMSFQLWGVKFRTFRELKQAFPRSIPSISSDSSQWNGQRICGTQPGRKAWHESGMTQMGYAYAVALPAYEEKLRVAWDRLNSLPPVEEISHSGDDQSVVDAQKLFLSMRAILNLQFVDTPEVLLDIVAPDQSDESPSPSSPL